MTTPNYKIPLVAPGDTFTVTYLLINIINATEGVAEGFEPKMPRVHFWMINVLTAVLTVLALGLNVLALVSILKFFYHFCASCRFVINLLLTDLLFSIVVLCRLVLSLVPEVAHSRALCVGFFSAMMCTGSTVQLSLLLALLDNFVTIVFPFRYRSILTRRTAHVTIAVIWFYSVGRDGRVAQPQRLQQLAVFLGLPVQPGHQQVVQDVLGCAVGRRHARPGGFVREGAGGGCATPQAHDAAGRSPVGRGEGQDTRQAQPRAVQRSSGALLLHLLAACVHRAGR